MKKTKLAIIFDSLFVSLICGTIVFVWLYKYIKNAFFLIFVCNIVIILIFFGLYFAEIKKFKLNKVKSFELNFEKSCFNYLIYTSSKNKLNFLSKLLDAKQTNNQNIFQNENNIFYIKLESTITETDFCLANEYYLSLNKNIILSFVSNNYSQDFFNLLNNAPNKYNTYYFRDLFLVMKEKQLFPIKKSSPTRRTNFFRKNNLFKSISKSNFKNYFFSGLSLIIFSLFVPFSIYYLVIGTLLLLLSVLCIFKHNQTPNNSTKNLTELIKK